MAFTYDSTTELGKLRQLVADTHEGTYAFTDAELSEMLTDATPTYGTRGGRYAAAAHAMDLLIVDRARRARRFSDSQGDVDETATLSELREQRAHYRAMAEQEAKEDGKGTGRARVRTMREPDWSPHWSN